MFRIQVAYHREPQVLRESVTAEGMLIQQDNAEAQELELETQQKPFLTSTLHGYITPYHTVVDAYTCFLLPKLLSPNTVLSSPN